MVFADPELDRLLEKHETPCAAFVTAANPHSKKKSAAENAEALGKLFGQNAIVFIEKGKAPELVPL